MKSQKKLYRNSATGLAKPQSSSTKPGAVFWSEIEKKITPDLHLDVWLDIYYALFHTTRRNDKASVMFALDAAVYIAGQPIRTVEAATRDVSVPWWVINAIGVGWLSFIRQKNKLNRIDVAFGMESRAGQRALNTRRTLWLRNMLIALDVETLLFTKKSRNLSRANEILANQYESEKLDEGSISKAVQPFRRYAREILARRVGPQ